jgi:hypothetical protein
MKNLIAFLIIILSMTSLAAEHPVSVPLTNPVYHFLDRMETLGILDNILDGVKPFSRGHVAELLININKQRQELTGIDRDVLDNFMLDFRFEINPSQKYKQIETEKNWYSPFSGFDRIAKDFLRLFARHQPEEENHVFLWEDSTNSFYFDFDYAMTYDQRNRQISRSKDVMHFEARGSITRNFGYMVNVAMANIHGNFEYRSQDPFLKNTWRNDQENVTYFDRSGGDIGLSTPWVDLHFAVQPTVWGLGESGSLILSDNVEQYPYISIGKYWSWGSFTFMHGKLLSESSGRSEEGQPQHPDKWIAINRFEFSPLTGMAIGLTGAIIYGNRTADWAYLFPINYFRAVEHTLGDRDNALLALDLETRVINRVKIYGSLFLDELRKDKLGSDWYGNKHGFQAGLHLTDPLGIANLAARVEYTAIMPWVYTHKYDANRYISNELPLGYWSGPNSEVYYAHLEKRLSHRLNLGAKFWHWKHGQNYENENIGGDILLGHNTLIGNQTEARETRKFLEGILESEDKLELYIRYEAFNGFFLDFASRFSQYQVEENTKDITELHFGFRLEY